MDRMILLIIAILLAVMGLFCSIMAGVIPERPNLDFIMPVEKASTGCVHEGSHE